MLEIQSLLRVLSGVKKAGKGFIALCPAHPDRNPSLSIRETEDRKVLLYCHAGCSYQAIRKAIKELL